MTRHNRPERTPKTQTAGSTAPPRPPKKTARGIEDGPPDGVPVPIPDPVAVTDLAAALEKRLERIFGDLIGLGLFPSNVKSLIDFKTASKIVRQYGYTPQKIA
ncbi:MAG TPA: translation initiation factor IF-2 N-terminal domain-containing protein [Candidatus Binatia bacterium]|nr:translation initiation factor IF-2 N-terminal domain-containing protein [Candidatus Binatia bacterium]